MCTIIKVKRKITDDPVDCLIIECKKKKIQNGSAVAAAQLSRNDKTASATKQILKYAGSATNEEEIPAKIKELSSKLSDEDGEEGKDVEKPPFIQEVVKSKIGLIEGETSKKQVDYVVLAKKRGLSQCNEAHTNGHSRKEDAKNATESSKKCKNEEDLDNVNIIDVISSEYFKDELSHANKQEEAKEKPKATPEKISCNGVEMIREKLATVESCKSPSKRPNATEADYVYDFYYAKSNDPNIYFDLLYPNANFEIKSYSLYGESELMDERNSSDEQECYDDEEDSNDEQNWRNDYPEEEDEAQDDNIDDENDDEHQGARRSGSRNNNYRQSNRHYDEDVDDDDDDDDDDIDYDEYAYGYDDDDVNGKKLASYMKKSLAFDRSYNEEDDDDLDNEYKNDSLDRSYKSYKKRILKEFKADYKKDF